MLVDVVAVQPLKGYHLKVQFEDGVSGIVDVRRLVDFKGVFECLQDDEEFSKVRVNKELGVVCWPNGADLDSDVLYSIVTGRSISEFAEKSVVLS